MQFKKNLKIYLLLILCSLQNLITNTLFAQQNCFNAIPICQNSYTQNNANTGVGSVVDLNSSNQGCLTNGEVNSTWYILNTSTAGNIIFTITPNSASDDYDFAVWDITDTSCAALANGLTPIRCNFASLANSTAGGLTGLSTSSATPSLGAAGPSFSSAIPATTGQTFAILINNNTGSANGYNINFTGSTAQIFDVTPPSVKNIYVPPTCTGPMQIKINLSENVVCSSIASNGSDFSIAGASVTSAVGGSCASGGIFSSSIYLTFSSALAPGTYSGTINTGTDGNTLLDNCGNAITVGTAFSFIVLPPVKVIAQPQFGCSGSTSGSITANGTGGYAPYKFKINSGVYNIGNTFAGLSAGTYTISIKDSLGCISDTIITLTPAPAILINGISSTNLTCFNANDGTITVTASGGNPPLNYAANSGAFTTSNIITNLNSGTIVVHVKDANGCLHDSVVLITSPGPLMGNTVIINNVSCLGLSNGSINFIANGGTAPLQYALNNGAFTSFANYTNLAVGTYTLHIKDAHNCTKDTIINITQPSISLSASVSNIVNPNCSGTLGSLSVGGVGGSSPYTYSINGTTYLSSNSFSGLSAGTYIVYVKDAGGCVATTTGLLTSPGNINVNSATVIQPTCVTNGSITITGSGGLAPLNYAINSGSFSTTNIFTGLVAGSYILHIKDGNNCTHDTIINLTAPTIPQIIISSVTNTTCSNPNSGVINVSANGGTGAYLFSINGGANVSTTTFNSLTAGSYTIIVQDVNGCTASTTTNIISSNTITFATATKTNIGCSGAPLGTITLSGTGGNAPYQYNINNGAYQASGNFSGLSAGTYTAITKDANGCTSSVILTIQTSFGFAISTFNFVNATCSNPGNGTINATINGGIAPITYTLNGVNYGTNSFSSLGPNTYTFVATDANGCTVSSAVTITGPPKLWFTNTTVVLPPCFGGIGSIITNGIGGAPPYTYSLDAGAYTGTANYPNLPAGTYVVHLKDANGCIHDTTINLIQPNPVIASSLIVSNASCNGNPTGSITVAGGGTTPPYQYNFNNGAWSATTIFNNLAVGTYTIGIKDANGCTGTVVSTINNNGNFYFNTSSYVLPLCVGASNGSITFSATGGALPYSYSINSGAYQAASTFTNLASATYTLSVKDNGGCIVSQTLFLPNPTALLFNGFLLNSPLCNGGNTGSIIVLATGGTGTLNYKVDGGTYGVGNILPSLTAGTHTITIKDGNGCTKDSIVNIANPLATTINVTKINPGCFGPGNGTISITGSGGLSPYTFAFGNGAYSSVASYNPLLAGTYTVYIKDANSCTNSSIIILTNSTGVAYSNILKVNPLCSYSTNGSITITASTVNLPLNYSINGGTLSTSNIFNGLASGTFTLQVVDAGGCFKDSIVTLIKQSNLKIDSTILTKTLCVGDSNGIAKIFASGGNGALTYAVNSSTYNPSNIINGLAKAIYTLHVKDNIGCIADTIVNITSPPNLYFASSAITSPYCNGSQDGIISISGGGGTVPYQYSINANPYGSGSFFNNLIQATYTFHLIDANGCKLDTSIFLMGPDIIQFANFSITKITCFGASDGIISAVASGGIPPYQYSINGNAFSTINTFSSLPAGIYNIVAKDNQGCLHDTLVQVTAPATIATLKIISITNNVCRGDSLGIIKVSGSGGTAPYTYSFNTLNNYNTITTFNKLYASNYIIYIKDANGCINDSTVAVTEPDSSAQILLINTKPNSCVGVYDASLTVSTKNGYRPYTYTVNGLNYNTDSTYTNLYPGDYVVEVKDSIGCKSTGKYFIDSSKLVPSIILQNITNNVCKYDVVGNASWTYLNVNQPVNASINGSSPTNITSISNLNNGNYIINIIDAKGCKADTNFSIYFSDSVTSSVTVTDATCTGTGNDGKATVTASNGTAPYLYSWNFGNNTSIDSMQNINFGTYKIIVTDAVGCKDTNEFTITYNPCCDIWIPNAFTPNGDDKNDFVTLYPSGAVVLISLDIYNRWGQVVFHTINYNNKWDGTYNGLLCDLDTYFYILRYTCPLSGKVQIKKGDITLVK